MTKYYTDSERWESSGGEVAVERMTRRPMTAATEVEAPAVSRLTRQLVEALRGDDDDMLLHADGGRCPNPAECDGAHDPTQIHGDDARGVT